MTVLRPPLTLSIAFAIMAAALVAAAATPIMQTAALVLA
jgi:hypothetical protein